jgi:hypothetical protein
VDAGWSEEGFLRGSGWSGIARRDGTLLLRAELAGGEELRRKIERQRPGRNF